MRPIPIAEPSERDVLRELNARLLRAQEQERSRLARDLHDDVTQRLARLAIDVGRIERSTPEHPQAELLRDVRRGLARLSEDVHSLAYRLHPSVLEDLGLAEAIRSECDHFERLRSTPVHVAFADLPEQVPPEMAICLFRIAQEALRNVARHAKATCVWVSLVRTPTSLELSVRDDGVGFDLAGRGRHSLGHVSMAERARLVDGELQIVSSPGGGTTVTARVPWNGASS